MNEPNELTPTKEVYLFLKGKHESFATYDNIKLLNEFQQFKSSNEEMTAEEFLKEKGMSLSSQILFADGKRTFKDLGQLLNEFSAYKTFSLPKAEIETSLRLPEDFELSKIISHSIARWANSSSTLNRDISVARNVIAFFKELNPPSK